MCSKNKGFSLIELIIVITIMAILTAILVPHLLRYVGQARAATCASNRSEFVKYYQIYRIDAEGAESLSDFLNKAKAVGLEAEDICPAGGDCSFAIENDRMVVHCSLHDYKAGSAPPRPTDTKSSVYVLDPALGKYVEINVRDTGIGQSYSDIDDKIIYYDGDKYEKGYYYINAAKVTSNITDMDEYFATLIKWNATTNVVKLNTDVPIQTYDSVSQNAPSKQKDRNSMVVQGQCYYVDFDWDDVDGPVLAMYTGTSNATWWRGDLSKKENGTDGDNVGVWAIIETK